MAIDPAAASGQDNGGQGSRIHWVDRTPREILLEVIRYLKRADLKNFILTCRATAHNFCDELLRNDIRTKTYDSLATACYFNDAALALKCLKLGASPNVVFVHKAILHNPSPLHDQWQADRSVHSRFQSPVFPTIFSDREHTNDEHPYCALIVATRLNHVEVMKVLLGFWPDGQGEPVQTADVVERRTIACCSWFESLAHPVILAHVRSVQATRLLLAAGAAQGDTHINDCGGKAYCLPFRAILSRYHVNTREKYNPEQPPFGTLASLYPRLERGSPHIIPEDELRAIVELLLENGAHPRQPADRPDPEAVESSLVAAITTGYRGVMKTMVHGGPWIMNQDRSECALAFRLVLNDCIPGFPLRYLWKYKLYLNYLEQCLTDILEAGASPVDPLPDGRRPLTVVRQTPPLIKRLLEGGADPNLTDAHNLCSLARSIIPVVDRDETKIDTEKLISLFLSFGANVNQPSLHAQGFSPLMFATGDAVDPAIFKTLLKAGAEREFIGELSPGGLRFTVLQCLLVGFPRPRSQYPSDLQVFAQHGLEALIRVPNYNGSSEIILADSQIYEGRERKFTSFTVPWVDIAHFYTADMRHAINWAIDNLFGCDLTWALKLLAPYYRATKLSTDKETPLSAFFAQHRTSGYLRFGTLDETYKAVKTMFAYDFSDYEGAKMQEILCCVCKLPLTFSPAIDAQHWEQVRHNSSFNLDFNRPFIEEISTNSAPILRPDPIFNVSMDIVAQFMYRYEKHRGRTIGKLIMTFLATCATSFYIEGPDGESPYSHSRRNGTLPYVDMMWRNQEKERQFEARLAFPTGGVDQVFHAEETLISEVDGITEADPVNYTEDILMTEVDQVD